MFPGFYGTVFEYDSEQEDIQSYNEENKTAFTFDDFKWDYAERAERICKAFVNRLETELKEFLPITIEFESIYSPREYNFANDSINVSVELDLPVLIKQIMVRREAAAKYFKETYTSYDGFISFHSPDYNDWVNEEYIRENTKHRVGALLECLCQIELKEEETYYWVDGETHCDYDVKEDKKVIINMTSGKAEIYEYTAFAPMHTEETSELAEAWSKKNGYVVHAIID